MEIQSGHNLFSVREKVVVLTGGLGMLGLVYLKALVDGGARVIILDLIDVEKAMHIVKNSFSCESEGRRIVDYYAADIRQKSRLLEIRAEILNNFQRIDVLINNAAITHKVKNLPDIPAENCSFENMDLADWEREIAINLTGTMLCCQVFGGVMGSGGSIINVSSIYGAVAPDQRIYPNGHVQLPAYGVTKGAIITLTRYLATYWGPKNLRVNCLVLGGTESTKPDFVKKYSEKTPLGRMAKPEDFVGPLIYLASDASAYSTGAIFYVDGGWTAW